MKTKTFIVTPKDKEDALVAEMLENIMNDAGISKCAEDKIKEEYANVLLYGTLDTFVRINNH